MLTTPVSAPCHHYPPTTRMVKLKHPTPLPYTSLVERNRNPQCAFTSAVCSRHAQNPGGVHWQAVKKDPVGSLDSFHRQQVFHAWHYQQRNTSGSPCEHRHNLANSLTKGCVAVQTPMTIPVYPDAWHKLVWSLLYGWACSVCPCCLSLLAVLLYFEHFLTGDIFNEWL